MKRAVEVLGGGTDEGSQLASGLAVDDFVEATPVATDVEPTERSDRSGVNET